MSGVPITLTDLTTLSNDTSAVNAINNNSGSIETAFGSALNNQGDQMSGNLDMNSNHIFNLPAPTTGAEPMRVLDAGILNGGGTLSVTGLPTGGSTNQVLTKHSNSNFDTVWQNVPGVNPGTAGHLPYYSSTTNIDSAPDATISNGALTLGTTGAQGSLVLAGATSGSVTLTGPGVAGSNTIKFPAGTTDFTGTGGASRVVKQTTVGGAFTVAQLAAADLSDGTTGTGNVVLSNSPTLTGTGFINYNQLVNATGYSLLGNTSSSSGSPNSFTITSLSNKTNPTTADILLISDQAAGGQLKYSTLSQAIAAVSSGVTTLNGTVGAVVINDVSGSTIGSSGANLYLQSPGGHRNKIRNGTMDVWQRGTSVTVTSGTTAYTADGWRVSPSGANMAVSQQSNNRTGANSFYCLRVTGASSGTSVSISQRIESYMSVPLTGRNCVFQAQIYNNTGSSFTPTLTVSHATGGQDNWGTSSTDVSAVSLQACPANVWTQVSYVFAANASTNGTQVLVNFPVTLNSGAVYVQLAEVDVRAAPGYATTGLLSFPPIPEMRMIDEELRLCRRYYQSSYPNSTTPGSATRTGLANLGWAGIGPSTNEYSIVYHNFPVEMRSAPTVSFWDGAGASGKYSYYFNTSTTDPAAWTDGNSPTTAAAEQITQRGFGLWTGSFGVNIFVAFTATSEI